MGDNPKQAFPDNGPAAFVNDAVFGAIKRRLSPEAKQTAKNASQWMESHDYFPPINEVPGKIYKAVSDKLK